MTYLVKTLPTQLSYYNILKELLSDIFGLFIFTFGIVHAIGEEPMIDTKTTLAYSVLATGHIFTNYSNNVQFIFYMTANTQGISLQGEECKIVHIHLFISNIYFFFFFLHIGPTYDPSY